MLKQTINYAYHLFYLKSIPSYKRYLRLSKSSKEVYEKRLKTNLTKLLIYSHKHIPYYQNLLEKTTLYKSGNIELDNLEQLEEIPVLTKDIIRQQKENLYTPKQIRKKRRAYTNTSGGSTGEPLKIIQDAHFAQEAAGLFLFIKSMRTQDAFSDTVYLWGAVRDFYGAKNTIKGHFTDLLNNTKKFNSAKLSPRDIEVFIQYINRKRPSLIIAYVNSIYEVACFVEKNGLKVNPQKAIHTGAGQLFDFMREKIEQIFQCKVFNHYGGREIGAIATECEQHDGLYILGDSKYVEVVDADGKKLNPNEEGDILVTTLNNFSMPLIRYKVEDRGIMASYQACECGMVYPKLLKITGRVTNNFKLRERGIVSGEYLTLTFNHIEGVINFQIRQIGYENLDVFLIVDERFNKAETEKSVYGKMKKLFGEKLIMQFFYVESIPTTQTGKHLFTVCEI